MKQQEKYSLVKSSDPNNVQQPESFTMNEFIEREQEAKPKGKKWLFQLLIVIVLLQGLVMLPYYIVVGTYKWFKKLLSPKS